MVSRTYNFVGFPLTPGRFRYRGRRCQLQRYDIAYIRALVQIVEEAIDEPHFSSWLLSHRSLFRFVVRNGSPAVLALLVERTRSLDMRRLAIWLLGRQHGTLGIMAIANASQHESTVLRREVARALKRKHAWAQLRMMETRDTDDRVRAIARQPGPEPHQLRLYSYLGDVTPKSVSKHRAELQVKVDLNSTIGRPPKSPRWIRRVLENIRLMVRGSTT